MLSRAQAALLDIRENIDLAQQIVEGINFDSFEKSRVLFYAATRCLEIISEASRRLPADMRERYPALPWREIMDAGNFYRHSYGKVAERFVWRTVHESLAPLLAMVSAEIGAFPEK